MSEAMSRTEEHAKRVAYFRGNRAEVLDMFVNTMLKRNRQRNLELVTNVFKQSSQGLDDPVLVEGEEICRDTVDILQSELFRQFSDFVYDLFGVEAARKFNDAVYPDDEIDSAEVDELKRRLNDTLDRQASPERES